MPSELSQLHGKPRVGRQLIDEGYQPLEEYADQGDTRTIRDLLFGYTVISTDPAGNEMVVAADAFRNEEVTIEEIGLLNLAKGEANHSFYTTAELERLRSGGTTGVPITADVNVSELGEYELSEWLETANPDTGRPWAINDILEQVGEDKDLAHRMLQAENIRSDGDPRAGLEQGLTRIIQGD